MKFRKLERIMSNNDYDILSKEVKKFEAKAEDIVNSAQAKRDKIISKAHQDAVTTIESRKSEFEKKQEDIISKEKAKIDQVKNEFIESGLKEVSRFEKKSEKNISKARQFLIDKLQDTILKW